MPNLLKDIEAVEVSLVDKPAINRQFLLIKRMTSDDIECKGVIGYVKHPLAPKDRAWDAGAEIKSATVEDLKIMCAFVDSSADADNKGAYKFPHHTQSGYSTVWRGVTAIMSRLSSSSLSDAEKRGVYNHAAKHYKDFGENPPDYKSITASSWMQRIKVLFSGSAEEEEDRIDLIDIESLQSLLANLDKAQIAVKTVIDELINKKDEGGPTEMDEKEIRALVADEIKKAAEPTEDQTKAAEDLKTADADFKTKTADALAGIKTSLDALTKQVSGVEGRVDSLEEAKPDKKSLDVDDTEKKAAEDKQKNSKDEASFKGVLFR